MRFERPLQFALLALVMVAAAACAFLSSTFYVHNVLSREAAVETRSVNAVVRRAGLEAVFHGSREGGAARLVAALLRPGVHEVRIVAITGEVLGSDPAAAQDARIVDEPVLEHVLRGEARVLGGAPRWASPVRPVASASPVDFVLPVFNESGASVIGAVALRRAPGAALDAAGAVVDSIWAAYLGFTLLLYVTLLALLRAGSLREGWARAWDRRTDPREAWPAIEADLRARAAFRRIVVRASIDPAQPKLAVDPGLLGVVLRAFAAHALECARDGDLLLVHVKALPRGVEFAYAIPGAPDTEGAPASHTTATLASAVSDAGGSLTLLSDAERGPRVVVALPS